MFSLFHQISSDVNFHEVINVFFISYEFINSEKKCFVRI